MGKVFVKAPVESPDDLLGKGPRWDAQKQGMPAPQRQFFDTTGKLVNNPVTRGAGKLVGGAGGAMVGALTPANSFHEWVMNMVRAGKIGFNAINSKSAIDSLKDKYMMEQKAKEQIRQQMQPQLDAQAALELKEKDAQAALELKEKDAQERAKMMQQFQGFSERPGAEDLQFPQVKRKNGEIIQRPTEEDFERYAREMHPGASLEEVADDLGRSFRAVQRGDIRDLLTGRTEYEGDDAGSRQSEVATISDVTTPKTLEQTANKVDPTYFVTPPQGQPGALPPQNLQHGIGATQEDNADRVLEEKLTTETGLNDDGEIAQLPEGKGTPPTLPEGFKVAPLGFNPNEENAPKQLADVVEEQEEVF